MSDQKIIDLKTRKPAEHLDVDENCGVSSYFNMMKKHAKDTAVQSVFIMTINKDRFVSWSMINFDEYDLLLAYATLDDLKEEIRDRIFPSQDEDGGEEETDGS